MILSLAHKWGAQEDAQECLKEVLDKNMLEFPTTNSCAGSSLCPSHHPSQPGLRLFSSQNLSQELTFQTAGLPDSDFPRILSLGAVLGEVRRPGTDMSVPNSP